MKKTACILMTLIMFFFACSEEDKETSVRNFRPLNLSVQVKDGFKVAVFWEEVSNSVSYTLQISDVADFSHVIKDTIVAASGCEIEAFPGYFYLRVRSNNINEEFSSRWQTSEFEVVMENAITDLVAGSDSVCILWNCNLDLGSVVLSSEKGDVKVKELSAENLEKKYVVVNDLQPSTSYAVSIFAGNVCVGTGNFKTKAKQSENQIVIDPSLDIDSLLSNLENGSVIIFEPGTYPIGGKNIEIDGKSVTLQSSSNSEDAVEIYPKSVSLKGKIGSVIFRNLTLSGFAFGGNSYDELNSYFIDFTTDFESLDTLIVEGCTIHHLKNCIIRGNRGAKGEQTVKYIAFRNCIVYNVNREGENSYENFKLDRMEIEEFVLENCTFYDMGHGFFSNRDASSLKNFVIRNCTFDNFGSTDAIDSKYLINIPESDGLFTIENTIFSNTKCYDSESGKHSKGFILGGKGNSYCYNNVFYRFPITPSEVAEWGKIESVFDNYDPKYADRAIGDFTIGCETLKNGGRGGKGIGDLRWIK